MPMSPMRRKYSVRSLQNSNTLPCKLGKFILFTIEPEHEINLRGARYELVPGYFVNSLLVLTTYVIREGPGEPMMCVCAISQGSRCLLS